MELVSPQEPWALVKTEPILGPPRSIRHEPHNRSGIEHITKQLQCGTCRAIKPAGIGERRLEESAVSRTRERADDVRLALLLTYITLGWMTIEGAASVLLGWASKSLLLQAFGIDSIIELFSASILLWRLRIEASGGANEARVEAGEHRASRLVGYTLYFLVGLRCLQFDLRDFHHPSGQTRMKARGEC